MRWWEWVGVLGLGVPMAGLMFWIAPTMLLTPQERDELILRHRARRRLRRARRDRRLAERVRRTGDPMAGIPR